MTTSSGQDNDPEVLNDDLASNGSLSDSFIEKPTAENAVELSLRDPGKREAAVNEMPQRPKPASDRPVAVVTGAARRVGREIALAMAERGLAVVVHHGTSTVEANVLVNRIRTHGGTAVAVAADLRDPRAAAMAVFDAAASLGEVTTLINRDRKSVV